MYSLNIDLKCVNFGLRNIHVPENNLESVASYLQESGFLPHNLTNEIFFTQHGKLLRNEDVISNGEMLCLHLRIRGGKGGFGSMLRAMGSQIEKTTNKYVYRCKYYFKNNDTLSMFKHNCYVCIYTLYKMHGFVNH